MPSPAIRQATYEDILAAAPHQMAEILGGVLHLSPRPAGAHSIAASALGIEIGSPFQRGRGGPGGWIIVFEPELHLGGDILVPDLARGRRERLPKYPSSAFVTLAPDWICEVLSPRTHGIDRIEKKAAYAREKVQYLWFVDPVEHTLETFELVNGRWTDLGSFAGNAVIRPVPFEAVEFELGALWADVESPTNE
jgi:Uma2 family endonuclease